MTVLWIVDRDGTNLNLGLAFLPPPSPLNIIVDVRRTTTFPELAQNVQSRLRQPVRLIRFLSHGTSGELIFSGGRINAQNVTALQFLSRFILPAKAGWLPGVELHGCGVASEFLPPPQVERGIGNVTQLNYGNMQGNIGGWANINGNLTSSRGVRFLHAMARICRTPVKGGVDYQHPDRNWDFEGPTITVSPTGQGVLNDPQLRYGQTERHSFQL